MLSRRSGVADAGRFSMVLGELALITLMSLVFLGGLYLLRRGRPGAQILRQRSPVRKRPILHKSGGDPGALPASACRSPWFLGAP